MNLLHLQYFYEVARSGSFMEGARVLRVSQPAVSKMVRLLEEDLGASLLTRTRKGVKLTDEGETLFQIASRIFTEAQGAKEKLLAARKELSGEWTLGVSDNLAIHLIPELVGQFREKHPNLQVGLFAGTSSQIKTELHYDRCQLGIFFTPVKAAEPFEAKQIYETEFWVVLAKNNRWFKQKKITLDDLRRAKVPRIESRHSDYAGGFPAHFHSRKLGFKDRPWLEVNQHEVKKKLVLGGFGYSLLTRHTVEKEVASGELIRVECRKLPSPVYAVWRKGHAISKASEAFLRDWQSKFGV